MFKGLDEMQQMAFSQTLGTSDYFMLAVIKLAALVVAAASGFRGGRIFPAVFVGVALGLMLHAHVEAVPAAITVSCSILGLVLVVTRDAAEPVYGSSGGTRYHPAAAAVHRHAARTAAAGRQAVDGR